MIGLENIDEEMAKDLIELVNSLKKLPKTGKVSYNVQDKKTGQWNKKEFSYTVLDVIMEKIKENNNFAFMQPLCVDKETGKIGIKCVLIHKSGKSLVSDLYEIKSNGQKIQDEGAEITYRKRYSAGAFLGVSTEEDIDGNDLDGIVKPQDSSPYDYERMTDEQQEIIANLNPEQKDRLREFYKKDPMKLTRLEAHNSIQSLEQKGLIKSKEQEERERKESEEVF